MKKSDLQDSIIQIEEQPEEKLLMSVLIESLPSQITKQYLNDLLLNEVIYFGIDYLQGNQVEIITPSATEVLYLLN